MLRWKVIVLLRALTQSSGVKTSTSWTVQFVISVIKHHRLIARTLRKEKYEMCSCKEAMLSALIVRTLNGVWPVVLRDRLFLLT